LHEVQAAILGLVESPLIGFLRLQKEFFLNGAMAEESGDRDQDGQDRESDRDWDG